MFEIYGGGTAFTQWTKDNKLIMEELPVGADVLFYTESHADDPLKSDVYEITEARDGKEVTIKVCNVPNTLLTKTEKIKAKVRSIVEGRYGARYSIVGPREKCFEVKAADKPADYVEDVVDPIDPKRLPEGYPYKEQSEVEVLPESSVTMETNKYIEGCEGTVTPSNYTPLVVGNKYIVTWDGAEYQAEAVSSTAAGAAVHFADGLSVATYNGLNYFGFASGTKDYKGTHTVKITTIGETIHPMAAEFLPTEEWTFTLEDGSTVTKKVVVAE